LLTVSKLKLLRAQQLQKLESSDKQVADFAILCKRFYQSLFRQQ